MNRLAQPLALAALSLGFAPAPFPKAERATQRKSEAALVRQCLRRLEGERRFAACELIIAAPENPEELEFALGLLCGQKGDRGRFIEPARKALAHADAGVRHTAARLLGEIGTPNEGSALVALLSDEDYDVIRVAVAALARIGGPNELIALDAWLGRLGPDEVGWQSRIKERREAFAARLVKEGQLPPKKENP